MTKELKEKYTLLANKMNEKSLLHVPVIRQLLECFEIMISEEEADFLLSVGEKKYEMSEFRQFYKGNDEEYEKFMFGIFQKGLLWITEEEEKEPKVDDAPQRQTAELAPIFPGWMEVCLFTKELSPKQMQLLDKFCELLKLEETINMPFVRMYWNRHKQKKIDAQAPPNMSVAVNSNAIDQALTGNVKSTAIKEGSDAGKKKIAVGRKLESGVNQIIQSGEVISILKKFGAQNKIALVHCFCRHINKVKGHDCQFHMPLEGCIAVGDFAKQMVKYHVGRYVTLDEAIEIVEDCQKKGAIHTVFHYGTDTRNSEICICNCCWDCCCLFGSYNAGGISNIFVQAHGKAVIADEENCNGCNICNHFCPTNATGIDPETGKLFIREENCVGCGQCVSKCPKKVRIMEMGERSVYIRSLKKKEIRIAGYAGEETKGRNNPGALRKKKN